MATKCTFFGVRGEKLEQGKSCKMCKREEKDLFDRCTQATHLLESTSVMVEDGETLNVFGPIPLNQKDRMLMLTANYTSLEVQAMASSRTDIRLPIIKDNESNGLKTTVTGRKESKPEVQRLPRVTGVIDKCLQLMAEGLGQETVEAVLVEMYIAATYPEEKAKARAHGIYSGQVREAKKKLK